MPAATLINGDGSSTSPVRSLNKYEPSLPISPSSGAVAGLLNGSSKQPGSTTNGAAMTKFNAPVSIQLLDDTMEKSMVLELKDGSIYQGFNFGAEKSISGELVFQTGMVGYPESVTDPSYRGQILVMTFPLVGNYGVPSRETRDTLLNDLPAHFEASEIHVAGLVVASYAGEDFSHHLAASSLGTWLKEQGVPAIHGVDTRALTKKIREQGSMLGKLLVERNDIGNTKTNGYPITSSAAEPQECRNWRESYQDIDWKNPNLQNLVAAGEESLALNQLVF